MADEALSVAISADVAQFLKNMGEVQTQIQSTLKGMQEFASASKSAGEAHSASAASIGLSVVSWQAVADVARQAAEGIYRFGEASIDAANTIDPSGALKWNEAVDNLKDSFTRFAGAIGKELRPQIEGAMEKVSEVFAKLSRMDWAEVGKHVLNVLSTVGGGIKSWATEVLETLTYPFRAMVGFVEAGLGQVMQIIGKAANQLGGTSIGKKLGLGEFSGDAFAQTGADMIAQGAKIQKSLGGAMEEVGKGLGAGVDAALAKLGENPDVKAILSAYKGASGKAVKNVNDAGDVALINAAKNQQDQIAKLYERVMGKSAADQLRASTAELDAARQASDIKRGAADYAFQQAMADKTDADGSYSAAVAAANQVRSAYAESVDALNQQFENAESALKQQQTTELAAAKAVADFRARADAALASNQDKNVKGVERAQNDADIQHYQTLLQTLNVDRQLRQQTEQLLAQKKIEGVKVAGEAELDYAKRVLELRTKYAEALTNQLDRVAGAIGGVTGSVESSASSAFKDTFKRTGSVQAAGMDAGVAGVESLLQNSAGFKKLQDAINKIMQSIADTVGVIFEPFVPVIEDVGNAIKPFLDALKEVLAPIAVMAAQILKPLAGLLQTLLQPLTLILKPMGEMLTALGPLVGPIEQVAILFQELMIAFDPFVIGLRMLQPVFEEAAKVVRAVVSGIASIWNGIVDAVAWVFDKLAHALPGGAGDAMRDFYNQIEAAKIDISGFDQSVVNATTSVVEVSAAMRQLYAAVEQAKGAYSTDLTNIQAIKDAMAKALAEGNMAAYDELKKELTSAQQTSQADYLKSLIAVAKADGGSLQGTGTAQLINGQWQHVDFGSHAGESVQQLMADLALAQAENTASNNANTKATQALTAALTNTPTGFRVGGYEYGAQGGANVQQPVMVVNGNVTVTGAGTGIAQQIKKKNGAGIGRWG